MKIFRLTLRTRIAAASVLTMLAACTPALDWREIHGSAAPFAVLLPAKPATMARKIDLGGTPLMMTMTAAEVDGVTFAVGSVELPDAAKAQLAVKAMKTALISNIHGTVLHEKATDSTSNKGGAIQTNSSIDLEAVGTPANGRPRLLVARFVAHNQYAYQVLVTGSQKAVSRDQVDTFMTSFKVE